MPSRRIQAIVFAISMGLFSRSISAADWPMWRYDAARSNASSAALPDALRLAWILELPTPRPAWPASQTKLQFDAVHQPIVAGDLMILGSTVHDAVAAYRTDSGELVWRFYAEGPVRFAPVASRGRIYVASDDGFLYCLRASDGSLLWKVRGGPDDSRIIGNDRLVSTLHRVAVPPLEAGSHARRLSIGYNRAADLIDRLEDEGVVSAQNAAGRREVLIDGAERDRLI